MPGANDDIRPTAGSTFSKRKPLQWLANPGYDPVYGARPLKRVIQRNLQNPLATLILEGRVRDGETIKVTVENGELVVGGQRVLSEAADD